MRFVVQALLFLLALLEMTEATKKAVKRSGKKELNSPSSSTSGSPSGSSVDFEDSDKDDDKKKVKRVVIEFSSSEGQDETETEYEAESDENEPEYEFADSKTDIDKAWNLASRMKNRNPKIWRLDRQRNVILSGEYTICSPLSFKALINEKADSKSVPFEAVQNEYYGVNNANNHKTALKYRPNDQEQDDLLSLIEIALIGNVSDNFGESYCWCPSSIHQDLFIRDDAARRWHKKLFDYDTKYGMAGHNLAFQHMKVSLKDIRHFPETTLNMMDQKNTFLYIHNYQSQCSEVISQVGFIEDAGKRADKINLNWGLTRVTEFVDQPIICKTAAISTVTKKSVVSKSRTLKKRQSQSTATATIAIILRIRIRNQFLLTFK